MYRKVLDALSAIAFILALGLTGGTLFGYLWITNPKNQEVLKEKAIDAVKSSLPIPGGITGGAKIGAPKLPF